VLSEDQLAFPSSANSKFSSKDQRSIAKTYIKEYYNNKSLASLIFDSKSINSDSTVNDAIRSLVSQIFVFSSLLAIPYIYKNKEINNNMIKSDNTLRDKKKWMGRKSKRSHGHYDPPSVTLRTMSLA